MPQENLNLMQFLKLFFWKYAKFTRPSNVKIKGKFIFNRYAKIIIDKHSSIEIEGDLELISSNLLLQNSSLKSGKIVFNNSLIELHKSKVTLGESVHFKNSTSYYKNSALKAQENLRVHGTEIFASDSKIEIGSYFFAQNVATLLLKWNFNDANLLVGNNTRLQCAISLNGATLKIGNNSFINTGTSISGITQIEIGNYVMISYDCLIFDNNSHALDYRERRLEIDNGFPNGTLPSKNKPPKSAAIQIKNDVWIGARCTILKGIRMEDKSIAATNTIISKNVAESMLVYGNPNQYKSIVIE
jgi:acetyltransferase-like isoleucine patch superfamily enzyme